MLSKIITVVLYIILAFVWVVILGVFWNMSSFSSLLQYFWNGGLRLVFGCLAILVFILPLIFRKKLHSHWIKPAAMLVLTGVVCLINYGVINVAAEYVSNFNRNLWDSNRELRICMIDDLESKYQLTGKTEEEIKILLGEPSNILEYNGRIFEYFISSGYIDPITYDIKFENGISKSHKQMYH